VIPDPASHSGGNAGAQHERVVAIPLKGEEIEHGADEVRGDPAVWQVANEARLPRIAADHLGPLVPGRRTTISHEEGEQLVSPISPAQSNERAHVPQLVGRVVLPVPPAVSPVDELAPVPLECAEHQIGWQALKLPAGGDGDRRGGRIEVAQLGCARKIGDAVGGNDMSERRGEIDAELVALSLQSACGVVAAQRHGGRDRAVVPLEGQSNGREPKAVSYPASKGNISVRDFGLPQPLPFFYLEATVKTPMQSREANDAGNWAKLGLAVTVELPQADPERDVTPPSRYARVSAS